MARRAELEAERTGVLFLHTATQPPLGADTWVHAQIIGGLDRSRFEVHAACSGTSASPTPTFDVLRGIPDLHVVNVDLGPELYGAAGRQKAKGLLATAPAIPSLLRLARYVRANGISLVHTSDRPRDAAAAVMLARLAGVRSIVHAHVGFDPSWMGGLLRWGYRNADARIAVSAFVAGSLTAHGHDQASTYVVHNAIDPTCWAPGGGRAAARAELGLPAGAPVVITVCRLFESKGVGELVEALGRVRQDVPDVRLLVVGQDLSRDGSYVRQLQARAAELGLGAHVRFTGRRDDVPRLMAAADVFAMPSVGEPFGLVYLEAMAMRLPVVALASGGAPEVVADGTTGLLSQEGDTVGLAANLRTLLLDPRRRDEMGARGRQRVEERFSVDRMARETEAVYLNVAAVAGGHSTSSQEHEKEAGHVRPVAS